MDVLGLHRFKVGARLPYPIRDAAGALLLDAGTVLAEGQVKTLGRRGYRTTLEATLEPIGGRGPEKKVLIRRSSTRIGRRPDCEIRLSSRLVSGYHCVVEKLPLAVYVADLQSTNGTFLNGARIDKPTELRHGDILQAADQAFKVVLSGTLARETLEARRTERDARSRSGVFSKESLEQLRRLAISASDTFCLQSKKQKVG